MRHGDGQTPQSKGKIVATKTVRLDVTQNYWDDKYEVRKLTNSVEWTIGQTMTKQDIEEIILRRDHTVVVTAAKGS